MSCFLRPGQWPGCWLARKAQPTGFSPGAVSMMRALRSCCFLMSLLVSLALVAGCGKKDKAGGEPAPNQDDGPKPKSEDPNKSPPASGEVVWSGSAADLIALAVSGKLDDVKNKWVEVGSTVSGI